MINEVLRAEGIARSNELKAKKQADEIVSAAEKKSRDIFDTIVRQGLSLIHI